MTIEPDEKEFQERLNRLSENEIKEFFFDKNQSFLEWVIGNKDYPLKFKTTFFIYFTLWAFENQFKKGDIDGLHRAIILCKRNKIAFPQWIINHLAQASADLIEKGEPEGFLGKKKRSGIAIERRCAKEWIWGALSLARDFRFYKDGGKRREIPIRNQDMDDSIKDVTEILKKATLSTTTKKRLSETSKQARKEIKQVKHSEQTIRNELKNYFLPENQWTTFLKKSLLHSIFRDLGKFPFEDTGRFSIHSVEGEGKYTIIPAKNKL